jgi:hypothetical protein
MTGEQEQKGIAVRDRGGLPEFSPGLGVRKQVPRPDRADKVAMTTRVEPKTRRFFKKVAAHLGMKMEDLQNVAFDLLMSRLKAVPESEHLAVLEAAKREAAGV